MESKKSKKTQTKKLKPKRKRSKEKAEHYVSAKEFTAGIIQYYKDPDDKKIAEKLGVFIYKIATGLSYAPNFINYSYRDDMVGDAIVKMFSALTNQKFNLDTGNNPFSYFTTIAFHAFINRIKKEKKQREIVTQYQEAIYDDLISEGEINPLGNTASSDDTGE